MAGVQEIMSEDYNGEHRRKDDVRIALLEQAAKQSESRHNENKQSLIAVHKRITEIQKGVENEVKQGLAAIFAKIDVQQTNQHEKCQKHLERITKIETGIIWIDRWAMALSTAIIAIGGWIFHSARK